MPANDIFLDAFTRVQESLHHLLGDLTEEELTKEPHPSIGWLAWRLSRVQDSNVSRLAGLDQLWIGERWHARFGMEPIPNDFGQRHTHTREQVRVFRAPVDLLLAYHDATFARTKRGYHVEDTRTVQHGSWERGPAIEGQGSSHRGSGEGQSGGQD